MKNKDILTCIVTLATLNATFIAAKAQNTAFTAQGQASAKKTSVVSRLLPHGMSVYVNGKRLTPSEAAQVYAKSYHFGAGSIGSFQPVQAQPDPVTQEYNATIDQGNQYLKSGNVDAALSAFQQARAIQPEEGQALVGLADAYTAKGDTAHALDAYRSLFYHQPGRSWTSSLEGEPIQLMKFALLLQQAGQTQEALTAYNRGAAIEDAAGGDPAQKVPLLLFGNAPGQAAYTPQMLTAMAHLVMGVDASPYDPRELRQAVALAPNLAAAHYYLGKDLYGHNQDVEAKKELQQAVQLGDAQTGAAAKNILQFIH